ncbi:hypothetical protein HK101_006889, partial [Irineochytrium annulatum]
MVTMTEKIHAKSQIPLLTKDNCDAYLTTWMETLKNYLNSTKEVKSGYVLAAGVGEHVFASIAAPVQASYQTGTGANDVQAFTTQLVGWKHAESSAKEGLRQHLHPNLYSKLQIVGTCFAQWGSVMRHLNYEVANRILLLEGQITSLKQGRTESDIIYAERTDELLSACRVINHPNAADAAAMTTFATNLASRFILGFREERLVALHTAFTTANITNDFEKMRDDIRSRENLLIRSRVQRQDKAGVTEQAMQVAGAGAGQNQGSRGSGSGGGKGGGGADSTKIFVPQVRDVDEATIRSIFSTYGRIDDVFFPLKDGKRKGYCFIQYRTAAEAKSATGKTVRVGTEEVKPEPAKPKGGTSGGDRKDSGKAQRVVDVAVEMVHDDDDGLVFDVAMKAGEVEHKDEDED